MQKIIAYPLIGLVATIGSYSLYSRYYSSKATATIDTNTTVSSGSIRSVVKVTGKVYPVQESNLTFTRQGTITAIYKKVGDTVRAGDLIAELDAKSVKLDLASSQIGLSNAQNNLNKLTQGSSETNKIRANNTLTDSEAKLILLQQQYETIVSQQNADIITSGSNIKSLVEKLALAKSDLDYTQQNIITNANTNNIERDVANGYSLIESSYQIITPSIKTLADTLLLESRATSTYGAIGENNQSLKTQLEQLYARVIEENKNIQTTITEVRGQTNSLTSILVGLTQIHRVIEDLNTLTVLSISVLRASRTSIDLPSDYLDTKISTIESLQNTVGSKYSSINSTLATLKNYGNDSIQALANNNSISSKKSAVTNAENDLAKAKIMLDQTKKTNQSTLLSAKQNIESQQNAIKLNSANYKDTINSVGTDLVSARNNVQSAQISLSKAQLALRDYQIYSTFDGIVRDIPWVIGDTVTSSSSASAENISITNSGGYEIQVSLDQVDVVKIRAGMSTKISLDAYANTIFSGTVSSVSPTPSETSGVVSYTAKILMPTIDREIYSNMSATVEIIITEKSNILVIPTRATKSEKGHTYVQVIRETGSNTSTTQTEVTLGTTDGASIEVLSGVTLGQKLKLQTTTTTSGTTSSTRSSTSGFGGGGGQPPF